MILLKRSPEESNRLYVYRIIKTNIMNLNLLPGASISEIELSQALQLSRTPIREVLIILERENLIEILPKRKSRISFIKLDYVKDGIFLRAAIEKEIIHEACKSLSNDVMIQLENNLEIQKNMMLQGEDYATFMNLDIMFHASLYTGVQKNGIWGLLEQINTDYYRLRILSKNYFDIHQHIKEHEELLNIIKHKNFEAIADFVDRHINSFIENLHLFQEEYGEFIIE